MVYKFIAMGNIKSNRIKNNPDDFIYKECNTLKEAYEFVENLYNISCIKMINGKTSDNLIRRYDFFLKEDRKVHVGSIDVILAL